MELPHWPLCSSKYILSLNCLNKVLRSSPQLARESELKREASFKTFTFLSYPYTFFPNPIFNSNPICNDLFSISFYTVSIKN